MDNIEAKSFTDNIFKLIGQAKTIEDLIAIEEKKFELKFKMDVKSYPKIEFKITPAEIQTLLSNGILDDDDFSFRDNITSKITEPLTKLLYSLAWKNGDLKKLKHIARGVSEITSNKNDQEIALVFYQFGKYLTKTGQPIVDQHVMRAFSISKIEEPYSIEKIEEFRQLSTITKNEKSNIQKYIKWLSSGELSN